LNSIGFVNQSFPVGARHGLKRFQFGSTLMKSAQQRQLKISSSMKSTSQQQQQQHRSFAFYSRAL